MAAALTLQEVLGSPAFAPTDMAKLAAAAAPGVMMLGQGPLGLLQTEWMERVTADLAEHQLMQAFAGTQQAHHRRPPWHGGEHAEATHQPHVLQVTILLKIHTDPVHSIRRLLFSSPAIGKRSKGARGQSILVQAPSGLELQHRLQGRFAGPALLLGFWHWQL